MTNPEALTGLFQEVGILWVLIKVLIKVICATPNCKRRVMDILNLKRILFKACYFHIHFEVKCFNIFKKQNRVRFNINSVSQH